MALTILLPVLAMLAQQAIQDDRPATQGQAPPSEAVQDETEDRVIAGRDQDPERIAKEAKEADRAALAALIAHHAEHGIQVDLESRTIRFNAEINRSRMPIEYLIVNPRGATHESLLRTPIRPSLLTSAIYLLGLNKGRNVQIEPKEPPPSEEELRAGVPAYDVITPSGDGVVIYVEWEYQGRIRRYRAEDLVVTEKDGRAMPWTSWVFLGSRFINPTRSDPEVFAADIEGNIVSVCYFSTGNQVFTNPHPWAKEPIFWPNYSLLPETGHPVTVTLCVESREPSAGKDGGASLRRDG